MSPHFGEIDDVPIGPRFDDSKVMVHMAGGRRVGGVRGDIGPAQCLSLVFKRLVGQGNAHDLSLPYASNGDNAAPGAGVAKVSAKRKALLCTGGGTLNAATLSVAAP